MGRSLVRPGSAGVSLPGAPQDRSPPVAYSMSKVGLDVGRQQRRDRWLTTPPGRLNDRSPRVHGARYKPQFRPDWLTAAGSVPSLVPPRQQYEAGSRAAVGIGPDVERAIGALRVDSAQSGPRVCRGLERGLVSAQGRRRTSVQPGMANIDGR